MLIVVNPRIDPETTFSGWLKCNVRSMLGLAIWAVALLLFAALSQPRQFDTSAWYAVSAGEALPAYTAFGSEEACLAGSQGPVPCCVSGGELNL